jgi:hypothetical protein
MQPWNLTSSQISSIFLVFKSKRNKDTSSMPPEKVDDGPEEPAVKPLDEDDIHLLKNYVVPL